MKECFSKIVDFTKYHSFRHILGEIVYKDFCGPLENLKNIGIHEKLDYNELILLMGLWVKNVEQSLKFTTQEIAEAPSKLFELLNDLHRLMIKPFDINSQSNWEPDFKEMFFYAPTNAYDIQYVNLVLRKYNKDREWIKKNTGLHLEDLYEHFCLIKRTITKRLNGKKIIERLKKKGKISNIFVFDRRYDKDFFNLKRNAEFLNFFSLPLNGISSTEFTDMFDFNPIRAKPIAKIDDNRYIIFSSFHLAEAIWESFYYKMIKSDYMPIACANRGKFAEDTVYLYLKNNFQNVFKNIIINRNKKEQLTDFDVCVIHGSVMLLFMVKTKKLTLLSRQGNIVSVQKDYNLAIKDSFEQGLMAKTSILSGDFIINDQAIQDDIKNISEIYIYTVVVDDYPYLNHQNQMFLKTYNDLPISVNIFDLEIILNYVTDANEFIRYTRLRYSFLRKVNMYSELAFLDFFRTNSQLDTNEYDEIILDSDWGQSIDADYYEKLLMGKSRLLLPNIYN